MVRWETMLRRWEAGLDFPDKKSREGFLWETSPLYPGAPYEEAYIPCAALDRVPPNPRAFAAHLQGRRALIDPAVAFPNLSGTAALVVPCPVGSRDYRSLRHFIAAAPAWQQKALWGKVAKAARLMMAKHGRVWVSTHGTGVPYLHVRIDTVPKYYATRRFAV